MHNSWEPFLCHCARNSWIFFWLFPPTIEEKGHEQPCGCDHKFQSHLRIFSPGEKGKRERGKGRWIGSGRHFFESLICNKRENLLITSWATWKFPSPVTTKSLNTRIFSSQSLTNSHIKQLIPKLWGLTFPLLIFFSLTSIVVFHNLGFLHQLVKVSRSTRFAIVPQLVAATRA